MLALERTPEDVVLLVFGGIAAIIVTARLLGRLFARLGQPAVVGEVVGGLVLGPSLLGLLPGDPSALLFPADIQPYLRVIAQFGLVIYLFIVGMELDVRALAGNRRAAISISLSSIGVPFVLGAVAGLVLHGSHDVAHRLEGSEVRAVDVDLLPFALFCGLAISGSAFAILARILDERGLFRTRIGAVIMGCAVVDDVAVWALAAVVLAIAASSGLADVPLTLGGLALVVVVLFVVVRPLLARFVTPRVQRAGGLTPDVFAVVLVGLLLAAAATTWLGISPILGAFLFGAALPRQGTSQLFREANEKLESISVLVLLPVFFVVTGLAVDVTTLGWDGLATLVLFVVIATGGKLAGAAAAASWNGLRGRRALAIGTLMNTRGLTELALLSLGRELGVLDTTMFTVLVCTAVVTTLASGPMLRVVYPDALIQRDIDDAERLRLAETDAYRVLLLVDEPDTAGPEVDLAVALARSEAGSEVVLSRIGHRVARTELGSGLAADLAGMARAMEQLQALCDRVTTWGVRAVPQSQFSDDIGRELLAQVERLRPNLVLLPAVRPGAAALAGRVVAEARVPVALVRPVEGPAPTAVVVGAGAEPHQGLAADVGLRLALAWGVPIVADANRRVRALAPAMAELGATVLADGAGADAGDHRVAVSAGLDDGSVVAVLAPEGSGGGVPFERLRDRLRPADSHDASAPGDPAVAG